MGVFERSQVVHFEISLLVSFVYSAHPQAKICHVQKQRIGHMAQTLMHGDLPDVYKVLQQREERAVVHRAHTGRPARVPGGRPAHEASEEGVRQPAEHLH